MRGSFRPWLALLLSGIFVYISASLAPVFLRNLRLQRYVEEITRSGQIRAQSPEQVRDQVVERARQLGLPVQASNVQVELSKSAAQVTVRYLVRVDLPGYTVQLHFAPSAGR